MSFHEQFSKDRKEGEDRVSPRAADSKPELGPDPEMEQALRDKHSIGTTLREQLDSAVAAEDYETAARIRDALRRREEPS